MNCIFYLHIHFSKHEHNAYTFQAYRLLKTNDVSQIHIPSLSKLYKDKNCDHENMHP